MCDMWVFLKISFNVLFCTKSKVLSTRITDYAQIYLATACGGPGPQFGAERPTWLNILYSTGSEKLRNVILPLSIFLKEVVDNKAFDFILLQKCKPQNTLNYNITFSNRSISCIKKPLSCFLYLRSEALNNVFTEHEPTYVVPHSATHSFSRRPQLERMLQTFCLY